MKKILLVLLLLLIGCTKHNDLTNLTIIKSIGITYQDNYHVYAQIIDDINSDKEPIMKVIDVSEKTIKDSFNKLKNKINNEVFFSHIDLLILDTKLNDNNYTEIINYFINNNNFRNDFYCVISPSVNELLINTKYDEIELFLKTNNKNKKINMLNFDNVVKTFIDNNEITLPNITYQDNIIYLGNYKFIKGEKNHVQKNRS